MSELILTQETHWIFWKKVTIKNPNHPEYNYTWTVFAKEGQCNFYLKIPAIESLVKVKQTDVEFV